MTPIILIAVITLFGLASARFGRDSRPLFDERREGERFGALR